ncbi:MAG: RNA polymerase subunit sigma-70 [Chloroflexi bacterium HGW-Chloroflexi-9]|nr:MAG: RNA polymerase subunit sigma-70 [Chloroflexi bacterium HGW-Chloroflexi-9]
MTAHDHTTRTPVEEALSAGRSQYLAFVRRRISDPDLAEDILQEALLRAFRAAPDIDDEERLAAWFYRVLRNAIVDAYRRRDVQNRRTERLHEGHDLAAPSEEDERTLCECFRALLPALRPEYAAVLSAVDLDERPPHEVAAEFGLTTNNLNVRRHRARRALRESLEATCRVCADHGCLDCTCETAPVL